MQHGPPPQVRKPVERTCPQTYLIFSLFLAKKKKNKWKQKKVAKRKTNKPKYPPALKHTRAHELAKRETRTLEYYYVPSTFFQF